MTKLFENNTVAVALLLVVLVLVSILLLNHVFRSTMDAVDWQEGIYRVERGDSLWSISGRYCPDSVDRREWIEEIQALNDLSDGTIRPGQKLIILTAKESIT